MNTNQKKHPLEPFRYCPRCGSNHFVEHSEKSKQCAACGFELFMNTSASTAAFIVNGKGELLVVRRKADPARGTLDLPGGFIDIGESAEAGVAREVMEETGLRVTAVRFLFSLPNVYPYSGLDVHTTDLFFRCEVEETEHSLHFADDAEEGFWIPVQALDASQFGLHSIRQAITRFQQENGSEILKK